jgi:DNA (cytosine-5)-methyltransferase 1
VNRPLLLDAFCCAGGASKGYVDAGFEVIGIDIEAQPHYPYELVRGDAIRLLGDRGFMAQFSAAHASPPCQNKSKMTVCRPGLAATYPDLIAPAHERLVAWGGPWIIENVEGAGLPGQDDLFGAYGVMLCGTMFDRELYRHRWFRGSMPLWAPNHPRHVVDGSAAGHWKPGTVISVAGNCSPVALAREVMGIDWTTREELAEAIPPYYAEHLGRILRASMAIEGAA